MFYAFFGGNTTDKGIEHHIEQRVEQKLRRREEIWIIKVDQPTDKNTRNKFGAQVLTVNALLDTIWMFPLIFSKIRSFRILKYFWCNSG
jgi:hypothetical protein